MLALPIPDDEKDAAAKGRGRNSANAAAGTPVVAASRDVVIPLEQRLAMTYTIRYACNLERAPVQ